MDKRFIGTMLVEGGEITNEQLETALRIQQEQGGRLGVIMVAERFITTGILCRYLQLQTASTISNYRDHQDKEARIRAAEDDEFAYLESAVG